MPRLTVFSCAMATVALLSGCSSGPTRGDPTGDGADGATGVDEASVTPTSGAVPDKTADEDRVNDGQPDLSPPALTPEAARSETGARSVLVSFARMIELKEFDQAWAMLDQSDQEKWSREEFTGLFDDLRQITVAVPAGTMEGAAGSTYYNSSVTITAKDSDGRPVRIEGPIVLRRVNDVPGASAAQLRWHIESLGLAITH